MLVTFKIRHATTKPGESAYIVGNTDEFGNWINKDALTLTTNAQQYPSWTASKPLKITSAEQAKDVQYKYIIQNELGHTFWENGKQNRKVDLETFFEDFSVKQESVHVWIVDEAFHNLEAHPIISRIQGCPCDACVEYQQELKMKNESEASTDVGTATSVTCNRFAQQIEKLLMADKKAPSKLQKMALVCEMASQEMGLPVLLAYLNLIKVGWIPLGENSDLMGDEILKMDLESLNNKLFAAIESWKNPADKFMVKIFKQIFLNLQGEKNLDELLKDVDPSLQLSKESSMKTQFSKLQVSIDSKQNLPIQDEVYSLISLKQSTEKHERAQIEVELQLFQKILECPLNYKTIETYLQNVERDTELDLILADLKFFNKQLFDNHDMAQRRGESISSRLQRHAVWFDSEVLEPYRQAHEIFQSHLGITQMSQEVCKKHPITVLQQILSKQFSKREMSRNLLESQSPKQFLMPNIYQSAITQFNSEIVKIYHENPTLQQQLQASSFDYLGQKCHSYKILSELKSPLFSLPNSICIPMSVPVGFGVREAQQYLAIKTLFKSIDTQGKSQIKEARNLVENLIKSNIDTVKNIAKITKSQIQKKVIVRASPTLPFLSGFIDDTKYPLQDSGNLVQDITKTWLSLYSDDAIDFRKRYGIATYYQQMSILIQEEITYDYGFKLVCEHDSTQVSIEITVGLLNPPVEGSPYKMTYDLQKNGVDIISFSDRSQGLMPKLQNIDYTQVPFTSQPKKLIEMTQKLGQIATIIQNSKRFIPEDLEITGGIQYSENKIFIFNAKSQIKPLEGI